MPQPHPFSPDLTIRDPLTPEERSLSEGLENYLFTSESVTEGHPDKICDQISDGILDAMIEKDPASRVAVETLVKTGFAIVAGEVTTTAWVDIPRIIRNTI